MSLKRLLETPPWKWPRDTGKRFLETLTNRAASQSDRLVAAELAGDIVVINDKLADALLSVVRSSDESDKMRAKAAIALGPVLEQADTSGFDDDLDDVPITEPTFHKIQDGLQKLYFDETLPKEVRRRILEAAVRAPEDWHQDAIRVAYSSGDRDWILTAVFAMRWVRGFDDQILKALDSGDAEIFQEAVEAAGNWELKAAWSHILPLIKNKSTPKDLLIAAIGAVANIRPEKARDTLQDLADSEDEDIAEAAEEAISMAEGALEWEDDEEGTGDWVN